MKRTNVMCLGLIGSLLLSGGAAAVAVTVNQSGGGDYTTIKAAVDSGATEIVITDSGKYEEVFAIGDPATGGPAVSLSSTMTGDDRPVITPPFAEWVGPYTDSYNNARKATVALFSSGSVLKNLVIEGDTENGLYMMADNVLIDKCLFRPRKGGGSIGFPKGLMNFGQQGGGSPALAGGRNCNGTVVRDSELCGTPAGSILEPSDQAFGFEGGWLQTGMVDGTGMVRVDSFTNNGEVIEITFQGCYLHHGRDSALFPSNRFGSAGGAINLVVKNCRFDAMGKFAIRGRSTNVMVDHSIFTRMNQGNNGDGENSAVAINKQWGNNCNATVTHCVFVNCGGAFARQAFYGGVNNHNAGTVTVDHCTFDKCLTGVGVATGGGDAGTQTIVSNCIFHRMGSASPPAIDAVGLPLAGSADLVNGIYAAWSFGLVNFGTSGASNIWTAVFNNFNTVESGLPFISVSNSLVGAIASEDSRDWATVLASGGGITDKTNVLGSRLSCGYVGDDKGVRGIGNVTRATPIFVNTDPWASTPYKLASNSPGQGLGAQIGAGVNADFDGDGDVDLEDFTAFTQCFNGPNRAPACQ